MEYKTPIRNFTDLIAWQIAHGLVLAIYKATKKFPIEEKYGLTDQMRRCAISVPSNIAEGFGRGTIKDKNQFYLVSKGSLFELHSQLFIARDLNYITHTEFASLESELVRVSKLLSGLLKSSIAKN